MSWGIRRMRQRGGFNVSAKLERAYFNGRSFVFTRCCAVRFGRLKWAMAMKRAIVRTMQPEVRMFVRVIRFKEHGHCLHPRTASKTKAAP